MFSAMYCPASRRGKFRPSLLADTLSVPSWGKYYGKIWILPTAEIKSRIYGVPGYPVGVTVGLTFYLLRKDR
jgi:hypothetical protein